MKIQNINNYVNYNGNKKLVKNEEMVKNKNYDVIKINKENISKEKDRDLSSTVYEKIKIDISKHIKEETSSEKIAKLKESISNNTYQIDVDEIVKKLLDK